MNYDAAYRNACESFKTIDPFVAAGNTDTVYESTDLRSGKFFVRYFNTDFVVQYPNAAMRELRSGSEPPLLTKILILHYLIQAKGKQLIGEWVNFRQLPGGMMYQQAFRAQIIEPIIRVFGYNLDAFLAAGEQAGGERARLGDGSFLFRVFPRVPILVTLWLGDDELPPSADILFDAAIPYYLSIEDVDAIGRDLNARLSVRS